MGTNTEPNTYDGWWDKDGYTLHLGATGALCGAATTSKCTGLVNQPVAQWVSTYGDDWMCQVCVNNTLLPDLYVVMGQDTDTNQAWVVTDGGKSILTLDDAHKLAAEKMRSKYMLPKPIYKVFKLVPWVEVVK